MFRFSKNHNNTGQYNVIITLIQCHLYPEQENPRRYTNHRPSQKVYPWLTGKIQKINKQHIYRAHLFAVNIAFW